MAIRYHRVRQAFACGILRFVHISSEQNIDDILINLFPKQEFYPLIKPIIFRKLTHIQSSDKEERNSMTINLFKSYIFQNYVYELLT